MDTFDNEGIVKRFKELSNDDVSGEQINYDELKNEADLTMKELEDYINIKPENRGLVWEKQTHSRRMKLIALQLDILKGEKQERVKWRELDKKISDFLDKTQNE